MRALAAVFLCSLFAATQDVSGAITSSVSGPDPRLNAPLLFTFPLLDFAARSKCPHGCSKGALQLPFKTRSFGRAACWIGILGESRDTRKDTDACERTRFSSLLSGSFPPQGHGSPPAPHQRPTHTESTFPEPELLPSETSSYLLPPPRYSGPPSGTSEWCMPLRGGGEAGQVVGEGYVGHDSEVSDDGARLLKSAYDFEVDSALKQEVEALRHHKRGLEGGWGENGPRLFKHPREFESDFEAVHALGALRIFLSGSGSLQHWDGRRRDRHDATDPAKQWIPIVAGQDTSAAIRASRRQERHNKKLEKFGMSSSGLYSNMAWVGNVTRINTRTPQYVSGRPFLTVGPSRASVNKNRLNATQGNFNRYYGYRHFGSNRSNFVGNTDARLQIAPGVWEDPRLDLLKSEWFAQKRCLDVGCNAGELTMSISYKFGADSMLGIDCDRSLINRARKTKRFIQWPQVDKSQSSATSQPRVYFKPMDFITGWNETSPDALQKYDTVCCFSVSKWVHLNHGDKGLMTLFTRCFDLLKEGGLFVLEPQPWRSYQKRRHMSETAHHNFKTIQIRPNNFTQVLEQIGFKEVQEVGIPSNVTKGFQRPIYVCTK